MYINFIIGLPLSNGSYVRCRWNIRGVSFSSCWLNSCYGDCSWFYTWCRYFYFCQFSLLNGWFGVFRSLTWLSTEFLNNSLVIMPCLQLHASSLALQTFNFYLIVRKFHLRVWFLRSTTFFSVHELHLFSVFKVNLESIWDQESEPLGGLRIESTFSECILPIWDAKVHDHEPEIIGERISHKVPIATEVLKPHLWFCRVSPVE